MKLIDDIINSITESKDSISDILRRCLVLAFKLKNDTLKVWVEKELNGYEASDDLPDYRKSTGVAKGLFVGAFASQLRDQPLPSAVMKPQHRHFATEIRLAQPIAAYERADNNTKAMIDWPQDLVVMYQTKFYRDFVLNRAWMEIPASLMTGLVDTVRTRILTFALQIRDELPASAESVEQIPPAVVERIMNVTIFGGTNVVGSVGEFNAPTVIAGDVGSLRIAMSAFGVTEGEFADLEASLRADGTYTIEASEKKTAGEKTLEWINKTAKKIGQSGLKIGGAVAEEAIKRAVFGYLGL